MLNKKRAQISIFIIVGAVLLITAGILFAVLRDTVEVDSSADYEFQGNLEGLELYRKECLDLAFKNAIEDYGMDMSAETEAVLEGVISFETYQCVELDLYEQQGFTIEEEYPTTDVEIHPESVIVKMEYPQRVTTADGSVDKQFSSEELVFPRIKREKLDGSEKTIISTDKKFEIHLPEGIEFSDRNGQPLNQVKVQVLDELDIFDELHPFLLGNMYYITSSTLSEPVKVTIRYEEDNILSGLREEDLVIAWYDDEKQIWFGIPSEVNVDDNTVSANVEHFSFIAVMSGTNINKEDANWTPLWYGWTESDSLFSEHLHRPCRPYYIVENNDYVYDEAGMPTPLVPESVRRYSGIYDEGDGSYYGQNEGKYLQNDPNKYRWYLNNFCDPEFEWEHAPEHCGAVYIPPHVRSLIERYNEDDPNSDIGNMEFKYVGPTILRYTGGQGILNLESNQGLYAQWNELFDANTKQWNPMHIYLSEGDKISGEGIDPLDWYDPDNRDATSPLMQSHNWKQIKTARPNEFAEELPADWDDDDQEDLIDKNCEGNSCLKCDGDSYIGYCGDYGGNGRIDAKSSSTPATISASKFIGLTGEELAQACFDRCEKDAESLYGKYSFNENYGASWNPSNDGILDFVWEENELKRNIGTCSINMVPVQYCKKDLPLEMCLPEDIGVKEKILGVTDCNIVVEDLATPMTMGYGEYRDGEELGYEGAGNNNYPVTYNYYLKRYNSVLDETSLIWIDCSWKDECVATINDKETFTCIPEALPKTDSEDPALAEYELNPYKMENGCVFEFNSSILKIDNEIKAYVKNKQDSHDVCAHLNVWITTNDGIDEVAPYYIVPEEPETPEEPDDPDDPETPEEPETPDEPEDDDEAKGNRGGGQEKHCEATGDCDNADYEANTPGKGSVTDEGTGPDVNNPSKSQQKEEKAKENQGNDKCPGKGCPQPQGKGKDKDK